MSCGAQSLGEMCDEIIYPDCAVKWMREFIAGAQSSFLWHRIDECKGFSTRSISDHEFRHDRRNQCSPCCSQNVGASALVGTHNAPVRLPEYSVNPSCRTIWRTSSSSLHMLAASAKGSAVPGPADNCGRSPLSSGP